MVDLFHLPRVDLIPYAERLSPNDGKVYILATAMFLAGVVMSQIGNAYACRTDRISVFTIGFWSNRFLLAGFLVELVIVSILMYVPPFQSLFELGPLPLKYWLFLTMYPVVMFGAEEARKAFLRRRERTQGEREVVVQGGAR